MIKKQFFFLAFILFTGSIYAQITVIDADAPNIGDIVYQAYDTNPGTTINIGSTGINQSWDFSSLQESSSNTIFFISPIGTNYENQYPDANLCMDDNGSLSYYNKTSTGVFLHGIGDTVFSSPALFYPLPLTYGLNISDGPIVVIDTAITGPFLSVAIPPATVVVLSNGLANRADTALIQITNTTEFLVDASGTLTTPLGTFDVLRLKRVQTTNSVLHVYCSDTILGVGMWVNNIPFSSIPFLAGFSNNEIEYKYQWITNDISVEFLLAEIVVDDLDNIINGVSFQTTASTSSITENNQNMFNVFPVPATDFLTIELLNNKQVFMQLVDVSGKVVLEESLQYTTQLDMSVFAKGIYYLSLKNEKESITKKVIIE
mgnify:CR=1 FL=1